MKTKTTNPRLKKLIKDLKKEKGLWKAVGKELDSSNKIRSEVNIHKINNNLKKGETAIVPGKVLGYGKIDKKINVAALNYSSSAKEKIEKAGGKAMTIEKAHEEKVDKAKIIK